MSDGIEFSLTGIDDLVGKINAVKQDVKLKGGRFALRKAAQLVKNQAKANALNLDDPITANNISKNIVERWDGKRFRATGDLAFRVGVLGGARNYARTRENVRKKRVGQTYLTDGDKSNPGGDTFHWRFLEFGTEHIRAKPFMRTALADNIDAATNEFVKQYEKALDRAIKKATKAST